MSYSHFVGAAGMNERQKDSDAARQQAMSAAQAQADQQAWERGRQAFQEQVIGSEQARRNFETKSQHNNARYALEQQHSRGEHMKKLAMMGMANQPAMAAAQALGNAGSQSMSGSWLKKGLLG